MRRPAVILVLIAFAAWLKAITAFAVSWPEHTVVPTAAPIQGIHLLSYNVEDLPWPFAHDRTADLRAIAADLGDQRRRGIHPTVVVLQEAFLKDAKAIGLEAGYRYAAFGPGPDETGSTLPESAADRRFAAEASFWSGEMLGKQVDSGLAVFSDYPIRWVRRVPFPSFACAGFDCLANKGLLAVGIQVPGLSTPLVVVTTHLNSHAHAHVPASRSDYAYRRQLDALGTALAQFESRSAPILLAGDFNVGDDNVRKAYFDRFIAARNLWIAAAERNCGFSCRRAVAGTTQPTTSLAKGKSMILYRRDGPLLPSLMSTFGRQPNGAMLSDHIGLGMQFDLRTKAMTGHGRATHLS